MAVSTTLLAHRGVYALGRLNDWPQNTAKGNPSGIPHGKWQALNVTHTHTQI